MCRIRSALVLLVLGFAAVGCKSQEIRPNLRILVEASSIPTQDYVVTEYRGATRQAYAVLLDIPDDGVELLMRPARFTEKIGLKAGGEYVRQFHVRVKRFRVIRIADEEDRVRGYLMVSNLLNDRVRAMAEGIVVVIEDPYYAYLQSPR